MFCEESFQALCRANAPISRNAGTKHEQEQQQVLHHPSTVSSVKTRKGPYAIVKKISGWLLRGTTGLNWSYTVTVRLSACAQKGRAPNGRHASRAPLSETGCWPEGRERCLGLAVDSK
jgi:hypothetical protein